MKLTLALVATVILILVSFPDKSASQTTPPTLPNPVLQFTGQKAYAVKGRNFIQYKYEVANAADYPDEMFAAAPALPPCGLNKNSSRTWLSFTISGASAFTDFAGCERAANSTRSHSICPMMNSRRAGYTLS